jgi:hypothetical protein
MNNRRILKTTLSPKIMNKIAELIEEEFKRKKIFYIRDGTTFNVADNNINDLLNAQLNANKKLISKGMITKKMLKKDYKILNHGKNNN